MPRGREAADVPHDAIGSFPNNIEDFVVAAYDERCKTFISHVDVDRKRLNDKMRWLPRELSLQYCASPETGRSRDKSRYGDKIHERAAVLRARYIRPLPACCFVSFAVLPLVAVLHTLSFLHIALIPKYHD
jgi:hypothetical protein